MMYVYQPESTTREWRGPEANPRELDDTADNEDSYTFQNEFPPKPDPLDIQAEKANKSLSSLFDCITSLFEILKTQDDEIKELREELAKHKATDMERHGWAGASISEIKDVIDQLSYGLGIVEKKLDAHAHVLDQAQIDAEYPAMFIRPGDPK